jgi:hypothetical protein
MQKRAVCLIGAESAIYNIFSRINLLEFKMKKVVNISYLDMRHYGTVINVTQFRIRFLWWFIFISSVRAQSTQSPTLN